jgi:hypothetical protein
MYVDDLVIFDQAKEDQACICKEKYKRVHIWWTVELSPTNSTTFNILLHTRNKITHLITWQVGSGKGINVIGEPWHPTWHDSSNLITSDVMMIDLRTTNSIPGKNKN